MKLTIALLLLPAICFAECTDYKLNEVDNNIEVVCVGGGGNSLEAKELLVKQIEEGKVSTVQVETTGSVSMTNNVSANDIHPESMGQRAYACDRTRGCSYGKTQTDSGFVDINGAPVYK